MAERDALFNEKLSEFRGGKVAENCVEFGAVAFFSRLKPASAGVISSAKDDEDEDEYNASEGHEDPTGGSDDNISGADVGKF